MAAPDIAAPRDAPPAPPAPPAPARRSRLGLAAAISALAVAGLVAAITDVSILGHWHGLFLLRGKTLGKLELKDDLVLGDGSRLVGGVSFSRVRRLLSAGGDAKPGEPWLELDWDTVEGSGIVRNHLADGTELVTLFARYEDSLGKIPHGLFVGGALPDIAADQALQNESGMAYRDARGWHHVWCNVNEAIWDPARNAVSYPSEWTFLGSRVLIRDRSRVVIESSHEARIGGIPLRIDRFAYFTEGKPWFKLGIRVVNAGEQPARYVYVYGDEPWVGTFGSADRNVGWTAAGLVKGEATLDTRAQRWAGIYDEKSGIADFVAWVGGDLPDVVFFANEAGSANIEPGRPLTSNEVFIGLEWHGAALQPGESRSLLLSLGLADVDRATGEPRLPGGAGPP